MRLLQAVLTSTLVLFTSTNFAADQPIQRQALDYKLFTLPFKPQPLTPRLFGLLAENEYLQEQVNLTDAQRQRIRQIERQLTQVVTVLRQDDVRKVLKTTYEQRERLHSVILAGHYQMEDVERQWDELSRRDPEVTDANTQFKRKGAAIEARAIALNRYGPRVA